MQRMMAPWHFMSTSGSYLCQARKKDAVTGLPLEHEILHIELTRQHLIHGRNTVETASYLTYRSQEAAASHWLWLPRSG